jgi:hypothetical protein
LEEARMQFALKRNVLKISYDYMFSICVYFILGRSPKPGQTETGS